MGMGTLFIVNCECGYENSLMLGVGMRGPSPNYKTAVCSSCQDIVMVDITKEPFQCDRCGSHSVTFRKIPKKCPKCGKAWSNEIVGFWD